MTISKKIALSAAAVTTGVALAFFSTPKIPANPKSFHVTWSPGGYSNFVAVTSTDPTVPLNQWQTFIVTTATNFPFVADENQRFFAIYGTNSDGAFAWAGDTNQ